MTGNVVIRQATPRGLFAFVALSIVFASSGAAWAQEWPTRAITAIVPFGAGSAGDIIPRIVFEQVSKQLGQPIVVENRPGAGGTLGSRLVAKAAPDGYTVLATGALAAANGLYQNLPYDTLAAFAPVIPIGLQPLVLVTAPSKGYKTLGDLIAAAKAHPAALNFASAGVGSASHFAAERLRISAAIMVQHVPFRGATEGLTEVIAGRIDFFFVPLAPALPLIKSGKVIALAVSSSKRAIALPDVPTTTESGLSDASYDFWVGLFLPAKTPRDIVAKLHRETEKALLNPSVRGRLANIGVDPMPITQEQFEKYFRDDVAASTKLAKAANIVMQK